MAPTLRRRRHRPVKVCRLVSAGLVLLLVCGFEARVNAAATDAVTVAGGHGAGPAADQLNFPLGVAVDGHGDVFVADINNSRILEWTPGATEGVSVAGGHRAGSAANQLNRPFAVAVDGHGDVFVADTFNDRVQEWTPGATQGITVAGGNRAGRAANQLHNPTGVTVDGYGDVFAVDSNNHRVEEWTPGAIQGIAVAGRDGLGSGVNQLSVPQGGAVDGHGDLFVADSFNSRVEEVSLPQHTNGSAHSLTALSYYDTTSDSQAPQIQAGEQVVVVATVNGGAGGAPPGGTVAFSDGPNDLGAVPLTSSLVASYTILFTTLTAGTHTITARYSGDGTSTSSDAKPINITVTRQ